MSWRRVVSEHAEMAMMRSDQTLISFFSPVADEAKMERRCCKKAATVVAMEMIPRISVRKNEALVVDGEHRGYPCGVMRGSNNFGRFFNGQDHRRGQSPPGQGYVLSVQVFAGLQAIGPQRLGRRSR